MGLEDKRVGEWKEANLRNSVRERTGERYGSREK